MSCCDDNLYKQSCCPDTPYPNVQHESVPSLIDNLVNALYGEITKTVSGGRVVWNIPCDPTQSPAEVPTIPREEGEGLLCYLMRIFQNTVGQYSPFQYWAFTGNGTTTFSLPPSTNTLRSSYLVYLNGVVQPPTAYTISNTNPVNIVFGVAPSVGIAITIVNLGYQPPGVIQDVTQSDATPTGSSQTQSVGAWLAYLLAELATKLTVPSIPPSGTWTLGSNNGTINWQQLTPIPAVPSAAGQVVLASAGSNQPPTWQSTPAIAVGPIVSTGSNWVNNTGATVSVGGVNYPNGATITTPRFIADRFAETVKVADFGAVGDGVTDDTAAIQAAIDRAVAIGNAIIEFEPKKYNLTKQKTDRINVTSIWEWSAYGLYSNHLEINGGTANLRLTFQGNGATLYTNINNRTDPNFAWGILAINTPAKTIDFHNLTIERGPQRISDLNNWTLQPVGIRSWQMTQDFTDRITFTNCQFINVTTVISSGQFGSLASYGKLRLLAYYGCQFLYPYGDCRNTICNGGGFGVGMLLDWRTNNAVFDGCIIDMAPNNGRVPNDCHVMDGFMVNSAKQTNINNCYIAHSWIEGMIFSATGYAQAVDPFTMPAIGSNVTVTINTLAYPEWAFWPNDGPKGGGSLPPGTKIIMNNGFGWYPPNDPGGSTQPVGFFEVVSGFANMQRGTTGVLKRLPETECSWPPQAVSIPAGTPVPNFGFGINIVPYDFYNGQFNTMTNCIIDASPAFRENGTRPAYRVMVTAGGNGYTTAPTITIPGLPATATVANGRVTAININDPNAVYVGAGGFGWFATPPAVTISGGGGVGAKAQVELLPCTMQPSLQTNTPTIVHNNLFVQNGTSLLLRAYQPVTNGPSIITGNIFRAQAKEVGPVIDIDQDDFIISNNSFINDTVQQIVMQQDGLQWLSSAGGVSCRGALGQLKSNRFVLRNPTSQLIQDVALNLLNGRPKIEVDDNYIEGHQYAQYTQIGGSSSADKWKGTPLENFAGPSSIFIREQVEYVSFKKNGWHRINAGRALSKGSYTFEIGGLEFSVSADSTNGQNLTILRQDLTTDSGSRGITKIRLLAFSGNYFVEVFVNRYQSLANVTQVRAVGNGFTGLKTIASQDITDISASGGDAIVTSNDHGYRVGDYVFISDSNSTPSINGTRQISAATTNTFTIAGITITTPGTQGYSITTRSGKVIEHNITSITPSGANALITWEGPYGFSPGLFTQIQITGSNSVPSIDGITSISATPKTGVVQINGVTITTNGNAGKMRLLQSFPSVSNFYEISIPNDLTNIIASDSIKADEVTVTNAKILSGSGAPGAISAPNGSIYMRTDGDGSTTLYVRAAGSWEPLASY